MKTDFPNYKQVDVVLRNSRDPFRTYGSCLVRIKPRPESRAVAIERGAFRVALSAFEITTLARAMARAFPRLHCRLPNICDENSGYVPGRHGRPFVVAFAAADGLVKVGLELADGRRHPVVELRVKRHCRVRWLGQELTWQPSWTEFRILCAEFAEDSGGV